VIRIATISVKVVIVVVVVVVVVVHNFGYVTIKPD
jgi:hypothetical protein